MPDHDRQADIRKVAKILRDGNYSYDQSADLFKKARREVGLSPPDRSGGGSPERLSSEEQEAFPPAKVFTERLVQLVERGVVLFPLPVLISVLEAAYEPLKELG